MQVSQAAIVLVCYSDGYKRSANCRMEAEYALQSQKQILFVRAELKYRPDGWLAFIMGQALYYDLVGKPAVIDQLTKHIKDIYAGAPALDLQTPLVAKAESAGAEGHSQKLGAQKEGAKKEEPKKEEAKKHLKWSVEEVQNWLKSKNLAFLQEKYFKPIICFICSITQRTRFT